MYEQYHYEIVEHNCTIDYEWIRTHVPCIPAVPSACPMVAIILGKYNSSFRTAKRVIDIVGALCGILIFFPLMIVIGALIKITSKGPVIFKQERVGYRGIPFIFYKFRTMRADCEEEKHREYMKKLIGGKSNETNLGTKDKPLFKLKNDDRVTRIGHILRKSSLDELPQFFNVLAGTMSLVGPRPPVHYEVKNYKIWHWRRIMEAKPGLTGLWQVEGRSRLKYDDMVRLDLKYTREQSILLDIKILLRTFKAVLNTQGAV